MEIVSRTAAVRGRTVTYNFVRRPPVAVVAARDGSGRYLLVRQFRAALGDSVIELPAGRAEAGESPEETARRELEEETGWRAERVEHLFSFFPTPGYSDELVHAFAASDLAAAQTRFDDAEDIELLRLSEAEVDAALRSGRIRDGKTLLTFLALRSGFGCPPPPPPAAGRPPGA